jgi:hypothetical protein
MPRNRAEPSDELQDLSRRTRELGIELRRKMFEKVLPQNGPRAARDDGPRQKSEESSRQERPIAHRRPKNNSGQ